MKTFLITGGGTGGHVYPALAIANEMQRRGYRVVMVGRKDSYEERVFSQSELAFCGISAVKLLRKFCLTNIKIPFILSKGVFECFSLLRRYRPEAVIATGGYVSAPLALASILLRIPLFCQEQNSYPGLITRMTARFSKAIFLGLEGARKYFPTKKAILTGNPVREVFFGKKPPKIKEAFGFSEDLSVLLVYGGSQGSLFINELIAELCPNLPKNIGMIWQTGPRWHEKYAHFQQKNVRVMAYLEKPWEAFFAADAAIARAGAMTISELAAACLPAILIPLPTAAENHQYHNAHFLESQNAAKLILQKEATAGIIRKQLLDIMSSATNAAMRTALQKIRLEESAGKIAAYIEKFLFSERGNAVP